ncbi:MAG: nicotinate phosphoribosyltransferase, partial [Promethearchaeota archaeon]
DAFGVGTELATSSDDPTISGVYKLIEYDGKPRIKISEEKLTYPGIKQIFRFYDEEGMFRQDVLALETEKFSSDSEPLLVPIMEKGEIVCKLPFLDEIRQYYLKNIEKLPTKYKELNENHVFELKISDELKTLTNSLKAKYK